MKIEVNHIKRIIAKLPELGYCSRGWKPPLVMLSIALLLILSAFPIQKVYAQATATYYFNGYNPAQAWSNNPGNMVDGNGATWATTAYDPASDETQLNNSNTCPGTNLGTITKVEMRAMIDVYDADGYLYITPVFTGGNGTTRLFQGVYTSWTSWFDITSDPNAPSSWTWTDVVNLDTRVRGVDPVFHNESCSKIEIRVTYVGVTPLTFNSKYVVTSSTAVTSTSTTLADDTQASQTFNLAASQTVLVIYNAFNNAASTENTRGKQIAINVDGTDCAMTYNSPYAANGADGATTFWIGTLAAGGHTITGRFASNRDTYTVTINERVLLILILNGDEFWYIDDATAQTTTSATLVNDPNATQAFTANGACKALIFYNVGNTYGSTENQNGKYAAINLGGADYSQLIKSAGATAGENYSDNVFTLHYAALTAGSYTAQGRFAARFGGSTAVTISRRQLGVLLFADTTLADYVTSNTSVNTTSLYPVNDGQALISRTTTDTRELLVVAAATEDYQTSSTTGLAYGIQTDGTDRTKSRTSPRAIAQNSNNSSTAWAETLAAGSHTVQGRYGNNAGTTAVYVTSRRIVALWLPVPAQTLLTFNSKYVVTSSTAVTTTSATLQDDTEANQTFSLTASQTVLVIYQANNAYNETMTNQGMQNAISIDSTDYGTSYVSPYGANSQVRNTTFWIGTLNSGSHTIKGRLASNSSGNTVTVSNRVLLIYILNGDAFQYIDNSTSSTTASTSLADDPAASFTFTPSGSCKTLILYNVSNQGATENTQGKKAAINIGGSDYSQAEESAGTADYADSVFTAWALSLSASSTTVKGRFAANVAATVTISRRQLGILMFADTTLLDTVSSDTQVSTTSSSLVDDAQATISRTTTDSRELLVVAMGTKRYTTASTNYGQCYGIKVNANDRAYSRGSAGSGSSSADSAGTAYAENLGAASHTIQGRFSINYQPGSDTARIDSRRIVALWLVPATPTAVKLASFKATEHSGGVLLRWHTGYEVNNLGFHVYREENGQLVRLTPEPVAGSAFLAGSRTALTAGHHYHWWDTSLSSGPSAISHQPSVIKYWLKDIDLNGTHTMHGPVTPVFSRDPIPEKFRPELLSEVGLRLQERYRDYWKVQELKEKIRSRGLRSAPAYVKSASAGRSLKERFALGAFHSRRELRSSEPEMVAQRHLASKSAVKIFVKEEGWYRVSQPELVAAGLSSKANPRHLQLYVEGREQPIRVIGGKDGRFGSRDAIEFYGVGLDTPSTDTRVYWLVEGLGPGKRVEVSHSQGGQIASTSFPYTVEKKERIIYFPDLRNGDEDNFFGSVVYKGEGEVNEFLEVKHLDRASSEDALLEVVLQGATTGPHRVKVLLNEKEVGELVFEGQSRGLVRLPISQSELEEGENLVSLEARGGEMDVSLVDTIRLTYWHTYTADDDTLKFMAQGGEQVSIDGFSNPGIRVLDITDPNAVLEVVGKVRSQEGGYTITFRVPGQEQKTLLALTEGNTKGPSGIVANHPSSWHEVRSGYDLVIIAHRDFLGSLQPLKNLRESQGLRVALVNLEDIYDEFSFGAKDPKAIKDFLTFAKTKWRESPRFVLLVGDASFDPRNYYGYGDLDFVPTKLIDTQYLETASDDWFVDFDNDGLPEMAIGRLPVRTVEEADTVISKIIGYERSSKSNVALLVADMNDGFNFEGASEEVRALLPSSITVRKIFRGDFSSDAQAKQKLLRGINQGSLLVNFIGHGSVEMWRGDLLTSDDAEALMNGMRLPFLVSMTCLNGMFQDLYTESLAEALLKAKGGGAIAVWASSGLTEPDKQAVMNKELIRLLFGRERLTIGEATARAKKVVSDQDIRRTWILFGDPTTRLK